MHRRVVLSAVATAFTLALSACGGGGSGSSPSSTAGSTSSTQPSSQPTVASSVSGVTATGKPVVGATVTAYGSDGHACGSAQTAADGSYSMSTQCVAGPVTFAVTAGGPAGVPLAAVALPNTASGAVSGTVNLTPLTTLAMYEFVATQTLVPTAQSQPDFPHILATIPTVWQAAPLMGKSTQQFASQLQAATLAVLQSVAAQLQAAGVSPGSFDPVTTAFTANGQGIDGFFDLYPVNVSAANAYGLGTLLSVQLPASVGGQPVFGGSAGAALAASGGATSGLGISPGSGTAPAPTGSAPAGSMQITIGSFTGALAGSSCNLTADNGMVSGNCTLAGRNYPSTGTLADNGFGFSILNVHPGNLPTVAIAGAVAGTGSSQGAWVDALGQIVPGGGSGNVIIQVSAN